MRILFLLTTFSLTLISADLPKSPDSRIVVELVAESPQIVTPTGLGIDSRGRVLVIESHTHFRPGDYEGPERDRVLMFTPKAKGKARRSVFYEGLLMGMDVCVGKDDWVYLAERSRILRLKDTTGDGKADKEEDVITLKTTGVYPHNGLSGLCFDPEGNLVFGLGENLGHSYIMVGREGKTIKGAKGIGGGVFRSTAKGNKLEQIARGFWNPFGICTDKWGRIFAVDNDPGNSPPCRLLHVVQGGDYGYRYKFGRTGIHPFLAWDGELTGTLPMVHGTGEGPCEVIHFDSPTFPAEYRGRLIVTSWGDQRVETYALSRKGSSVTAKMTPLVQGDDNFRPVGMAMAPDGNLYVSDWGSSSYNLNKKGRLWRIRPSKNFKAKALIEPAHLRDDQKILQALRNGRTQKGKSIFKIALDDPDPFVRHAALRSIEPRSALPAYLSAHIGSNQPSQAELKKLIKTNPDILFQFLRWTAEEGIEANRQTVELHLKNPENSFRIFKAALAALDALDERNNPDRFNEKFALPLLRNPSTPDSLRANVLRYFPDNHKAIHPNQLASWIQSANPDLRLEAIWKSRFHPSEHTTSALAKLALDIKAKIHDRLEAVAALGAANPPDDANSLFKLIPAKANPLLKAEAQRSLGNRKPPNIATYPALSDTISWLKRLDNLPGKANTDTGRRIFFNRRIGTCGNCHQVNERGTRVGPDLTHIGRGISRERLLESILEPNKEVSPYLRPWAITMNDGTTHTGIAMRRGGNSEAYLGIDGKEFRIDKRKIKAKQELHTSLMPPGLVYTMSLGELRDLLAFLLQQR
ncbi:MAG: hypothetical protein P8M70_04850 [Verrucomicrobiota bacterium]|nr:hypothetical protein [Verrucomicrobiota bacterium]